MPSCRVDTSRLRIKNNRLDHEHHQQDKYNVTRAHSGSLSYTSAHQHTCYDSENCDTQLKCVDTDKSLDSDKCVDSDQCAHLNKCTPSENYDMTVKCVDSVECKDTVEFDATAKCVDYIKCADIVSREDHVKGVDYTKYVDSVGCTVQCIDSVKSVSDVKRVDPLIHNDATPLDSTINGTSVYRPTGPTRVLDYLYVGSADDAGSYSVLRELGITHLLNCAAEQNGTQTESAMARFGGNTGVLQHVGFAADDNAAYDILQHLSYAVNFINASYKQGRTVLVYCAKGINRSVAITVGYLMQECQMSFAQAFGAVKTKRQHVLTNPGFIEQLHNFSPATVHSDS